MTGLFPDGHGRAFWYEPDTGTLHWGDTHYLIFHNLYGSDQAHEKHLNELGIFGWIFPSDYYDGDNPNAYDIDFGTDFGWGANHSNTHLIDEAIDAVEHEIGYPAESVTSTGQTHWHPKVGSVTVDRHHYTCFGYVNGILYLGARHHMAIMQQLLDHGMTWEDLINAEQAWGWCYQYEPGTWSDLTQTKIKLGFSTDAATYTPAGVEGAREAFSHLFQTPDVVTGDTSQSNEEYAPKMKNLYGEEGAYITAPLPEVLVYNPSTGEKQLWQPAPPSNLLPKSSANLPLPGSHGENGEYYSCFGYLNGILFLGRGHHMAIMRFLTENGIMSWEDLMNARQAWGWLYSIRKGEPDRFTSAADEADKFDLSQWQQGQNQNVPGGGYNAPAATEDRGYFRVTSDAGLIDATLIPDIARSLSDAYGIPFRWMGALWQTNYTFAPNFQGIYGEQGYAIGNPIIDVLIYKDGVGFLTPDQLKQQEGHPIPGQGTPPPKLTFVWQEDENLYDSVA